MIFWVGSNLAFSKGSDIASLEGFDLVSFEEIEALFLRCKACQGVTALDYFAVGILLLFFQKILRGGYCVMIRVFLK